MCDDDAPQASVMSDERRRTNEEEDETPVSSRFSRDMDLLFRNKGVSDDDVLAFYFEEPYWKHREEFVEF